MCSLTTETRIYLELATSEKSPGIRRRTLLWSLQQLNTFLRPSYLINTKVWRQPTMNTKEIWTFIMYSRKTTMKLWREKIDLDLECLEGTWMFLRDLAHQSNPWIIGVLPLTSYKFQTSHPSLIHSKSKGLVVSSPTPSMLMTSPLPLKLPLPWPPRLQNNLLTRSTPFPTDFLLSPTVES